MDQPSCVCPEGQSPAGSEKGDAIIEPAPTERTRPWCETLVHGTCQSVPGTARHVPCTGRDGRVAARGDLHQAKKQAASVV